MAHIVISICCCLCDIAGENKVLAGKAGAIDAVVAVLRAHVGNAEVSKGAFQAITNICADDGACAVYL